MYAAAIYLEFCANVFSDNDFSDFVRPEHYIRYIGVSYSIFGEMHFYTELSEPLESDLVRQVEYDMDEQGP